VFFAIKYQLTQSRLWLYASFLAVGLAASSKFTGGSLLLVPLFTLVFMNWKTFWRNLVQSAEVLLIGGVLSFGGYVIGTPKALLWMSYYFKRVIPALQRYPQFGQNTGSSIGLIGQWSVFKDAVGVFAFSLFIFSFLWFTGRLILNRLGKTQMNDGRRKPSPF